MDCQILGCFMYAVSLAFQSSIADYRLKPEVSINDNKIRSEQGRDPVELQGSINPQLVKLSNTVNQICRRPIAMIGKVSILIGGLILAYAAFSHRDYVKLKVRSDANAHSDALLTPEVCIQAFVGFAFVLVGLLYNLRIRSVKTGADVKGKTFGETFAENDFQVFNSRRKQLSKLQASK